MKNVIRIGTRGSPLALWQANETARLLRDAGYPSIIVPIRTTGDQRRDVSLAAIGGKGLFIKELEEALSRGEIDVAVHSLKDVPSIIPDDFILAGFLERADPRDAWLQRDGIRIEDLPEGAVVGTSAPRRRAQILEHYPHLRVADIRGNVETRIARMRDGLYAGVVLAGAGLARLERTGEILNYFDVDRMVPATGQGIVAIETLRWNDSGREAAASISNRASELAARCERGVLQQFAERLDCTSCIAIHASSETDDDITIRAFASDCDGTKSIRIIRRGGEPDALVRAVAQELMRRGALALLDQRSEDALGPQLSAIVVGRA